MMGFILGIALIVFGTSFTHDDAKTHVSITTTTHVVTNEIHNKKELDLTAVSVTIGRTF